MNKDFVMMFEEFDNSLYEEDIDQEVSTEQPTEQETEQPTDQSIDPPTNDGDPNKSNATSSTDIQQIETNYKKTVAELSSLIAAKYPKANIGRVIDRIKAGVATVYVSMEMQNTNQTRSAAMAVKETMRQNQSHMPFLTVQHIVDIAKYTYTGLGPAIFPDANRNRYLRNPEYIKALNYVEKYPNIVKTIK